MLFGSQAHNDFPELSELLDRALARVNNDRITLTETGMELSDTIGPWLFSKEMQSRMEQYELT